MSREKYIFFLQIRTLAPNTLSATIYMVAPMNLMSYFWACEMFASEITMKMLLKSFTRHFAFLHHRFVILNQLHVF